LAVSFPLLPLLNVAFAAGDMPMGGGGGGGEVQKNGPTSDTQQGPTIEQPPPEEGDGGGDQKQQQGPEIIQPPEDEASGGDTDTSTSPNPTICPAEKPDCTFTVKHKKNNDGTSEETYEYTTGAKVVQKFDSNNKIVEETRLKPDGTIFRQIKFNPNDGSKTAIQISPDGEKTISVFAKGDVMDYTNMISQVVIASDGNIIEFWSKH
jgi:hypothetical protein